MEASELGCVDGRSAEPRLCESGKGKACAERRAVDRCASGSPSVPRMLQPARHASIAHRARSPRCPARRAPRAAASRSSATRCSTSTCAATSSASRPKRPSPSCACASATLRPRRRGQRRAERRRHRRALRSRGGGRRRLGGRDPARRCSTRSVQATRFARRRSRGRRRRRRACSRARSSSCAFDEEDDADLDGRRRRARAGGGARRRRATPTRSCSRTTTRACSCRSVIEAAIDVARARGIPIVVDPKYRNFFCYRGATIFKPNRRELEAALGAAVDLDHPDALPATLRAPRRRAPPAHARRARDGADLGGRRGRAASRRRRARCTTSSARATR